MTSLEVGMYILLGVFCIAIAIFMASCFVYASKHQHQPAFPLQQKSQSVQNAHDWVWLGRQTLDKSSVQSSSSRDPLDNNANSIRSRESSRTYQARTPPGLPFRFEASADVNIFPNPCSEYGFNHGKRERVGRELYAELPRKRMSPRHRQDSIGSENQQLYQNSVMASPRLSSRSPFLERRKEIPSSPASPHFPQGHQEGPASLPPLLLIQQRTRASVQLSQVRIYSPWASQYSAQPQETPATSRPRSFLFRQDSRTPGRHSSWKPGKTSSQRRSLLRATDSTLICPMTLPLATQASDSLPPPHFPLTPRPVLRTSL